MLSRRKKPFRKPCKRPIYPTSGTMRTDYNAAGFFAWMEYFMGTRKGEKLKGR